MFTHQYLKRGFSIRSVLILLFTIQDVGQDITSTDMDPHGLVSNAQLEPTVTERMLSHALAVLREQQHPLKEAHTAFFVTKVRFKFFQNNCQLICNLLFGIKFFSINVS